MNVYITENKDSFQNLGKNFLQIMANGWKSLSEEEKKPYIQKSHAEKEAYLAYIKEHGKPIKA